MVQAMHMLLRHSGMQEQGIGQGAGPMLACYVAAAMHDFEHGGLTNDFLVASADELALTYNDRSPWESHHLAAGFKLLQRPKYDFLLVGWEACSTSCTCLLSCTVCVQCRTSGEAHHLG